MDFSWDPSDKLQLRGTFVTMRGNRMLHRRIEHFLFRARDFQCAILLARVIRAIDRFSHDRISNWGPFDGAFLRPNPGFLLYGIESGPRKGAGINKENWRAPFRLRRSPYANHLLHDEEMSNNSGLTALRPY